MVKIYTIEAKSCSLEIAFVQSFPVECKISHVNDFFLFHVGPALPLCSRLANGKMGKLRCATYYMMLRRVKLVCKPSLRQVLTQNK